MTYLGVLCVLCVEWATNNSTTALARPKRQVGEDDDERDESESCPSHESGVGDVPRSLGLDAGDGSDGSDEDCEAKPCEPSHHKRGIHVRCHSGDCRLEKGTGINRLSRSAPLTEISDRLVIPPRTCIDADCEVNNDRLPQQHTTDATDGRPGAVVVRAPSRAGPNASDSRRQNDGGAEESGR